MKKTKMLKRHRQILLDYGTPKIATTIDRTRENQLYALMLTKANAAIRQKYPEADMLVIRKYKLERADHCLRFQFPSGRVDGFQFTYGSGILDMPRTGGCYLGSDVFPVDIEFEAAMDEHQSAKRANDTLMHQKQSDFQALVNVAQYVEDVLEIIPVPEDVRKQLFGHGTSLVAFSPETIERLRADFADTPKEQVAQGVAA